MACLPTVYYGKEGERKRGKEVGSKRDGGICMKGETNGFYDDVKGKKYVERKNTEIKRIYIRYNNTSILS